MKHAKKVYRFLFPVDNVNLYRALTFMMLICAALHLATCLYIAVRHGDPDVVNMFNIIGVSLFFPSLGHGTLNCLLGIVAVILGGVGIYCLEQYHDVFNPQHK